MINSNFYSNRSFSDSEIDIYSKTSSNKLNKSNLKNKFLYLKSKITRKKVDLLPNDDHQKLNIQQIKSQINVKFSIDFSISSSGSKTLSSTSISLDSISLTDLSSSSNSVRSRIEFFESKSNNAIQKDESTAVLALKLRKEFAKKFKNPAKSNPRIKLTDFSLICTVGNGSYGRVILSYHKNSKNFYALKVINKEQLVKNEQVSHTINERNILSACMHPNIIKLFQCFKDNTNIYLIIELTCHGDLYSLLKQNKYFSEEQSKFYAGNIFLAFEYLHANNIIYRDLKPENILVARNGYLKLTDFGFAKRVNNKTYTLCGTPDYLSPEVLNQKPYGKSVDWWSFGIFIYESNRGKPPFSGSGSNLNSLFDSIRKGLFKIPKHFSLNLADICKRLIEVNVSKRLGCLKGESEDVKRHKWLNEIEWMKLYKQTIPSPYVPKSIEPLDIAFKNSPNKEPEEPLQISKLNKYKNEFFEF